MNDSFSISDLIKTDHIKLKQLSKNYFISGGNIDDQLIHSFKQHIEHEEDSYLTISEKMITPKLSQSLAPQFQQTKYSSHLKVYPSSSINLPL